MISKSNAITAATATGGAFLAQNLTSKSSRLVQGAAVFGAILLAIGWAGPAVNKAAG
jgi:hypothetical protein